MSVIDTIKTWSVMETIISVFGMALVLVMNLIV
jgi:H+/gluconate symporter-like permease